MASMERRWGLSGPCPPRRGERASQSLRRKYEHMFIILQVILLTEVLVFNGQISSYTRIVTDGVLELAFALGCLLP